MTCAQSLSRSHKQERTRDCQRYQKNAGASRTAPASRRSVVRCHTFLCGRQLYLRAVTPEDAAGRAPVAYYRTHGRLSGCGRSEDR
jgi:hypothetical protein